MCIRDRLEGLQGDKGQDYYYSVLVPPGKDKLVIDLERSDYQSDNDADLFVSFEEKPTSIEAQCQSKTYESKEQCSFNNPEAGVYLILVRGYFNFENYQLTARIE